MKRRARETFVLGAERLADEAELDLRNEAEADHEPNSELDQTAPAEPAIFLPQEAAGPPAGAGDSRARPSASAHVPWRPRPPLAVLALGGAAVVAGLLLLLRGGDDAQRPAPPLSDARAPVASAPAISDQRGRRDLGGEGDGVEDRRPAHRSEAAAKPDDRTSRRELALSTATNEGAEHSEPPARPPTPAVTPAPSAPVSAPPPATTAAEPVQSAASVRQEFGP